MSWLAFANAITKPLWFVFVIFSANALGVSDFGVYTFSISYLLMFSLLMDLGLEQLLIRDVARDKNNLNRYFNNAIAYKFSASVIVAVIVFSIIYFSDYPEKIKQALFIMYFFMLSLSFTTFMRAFFRAFEKIKYESISIVIEKLSAILFAALGLALSFGLYGFLAGLVIGNINCLGYCVWILFKKNKELVFKPEFKEIVKLLKGALPFLVADIFIIIYFRLSSVMIMFITGSETEVGLFNSSYRLIEMYIALPMLLVTPVYPFLSRMFSQKREECLMVAEKIMKILLIIALPLTAIVFTDYIRINEFLFSSQYLAGAEGLRVIILVVIPLSVNVLLGTILAAIGRQKEAAISVGISAGINLILNYFLINSFRYIGASYTVLVSEWIITILYLYFVLRYFGKFSLTMFLPRLLVIGVLTGLINYFVLISNTGVIPALLVSGTIYIFMLFVSGLVKLSHFSEYYKLLKEK